MLLLQTRSVYIVYMFSTL